VTLWLSPALGSTVDMTTPMWNNLSCQPGPTTPCYSTPHLAFSLLFSSSLLIFYPLECWDTYMCGRAPTKCLQLRNNWLMRWNFALPGRWVLVLSLCICRNRSPLWRPWLCYSSSTIAICNVALILFNYGPNTPSVSFSPFSFIPIAYLTASCHSSAKLWKVMVTRHSM